MKTVHGFQRGLSAVVVLSLAISLVGCSSSDDKPPRYPAKGTVTYESEPVNEGNVMFVNDRGDVTGAEIGAGGNFELELGLEAGTYKVYVVPPSAQMGAGPSDPSNLPEGQADAHENIPQKYRSVGTSGLTVEVTEGENTLDIAMQAG